jgi:uncharacterized membrane protein
MNYKVSSKRHLAKTISYRIISTGIGFAIMWIATGSVKFGAAFGVAELLYKPIQYYIHERVWYRWIKFGLVQEKKPKSKKTNSITEDVSIVVEETKEPKKKVLNYRSNR